MGRVETGILHRGWGFKYSQQIVITKLSTNIKIYYIFHEKLGTNYICAK
jgi:hypothetical protein